MKKVAKKKKKDISIDDLAIMIGKGFSSVDKRFDAVEKRFEGIDKSIGDLQDGMKLVRREMLPVCSRAKRLICKQQCREAVAESC